LPTLDLTVSFENNARPHEIRTSHSVRACFVCVQTATAQSEYKHVGLLANISRSRYVAIATQPVQRLQIRPILHNYRVQPLPLPKLHPGPCSSVGMRPRTDRQTHRRAWSQYISRRLRLMRNV